MKKLVAGLLAALMLCGSVVSVNAQNNTTAFNSYAVGVPGFTLNANGSNWGQVFNIAGLSGSWALGAGSAINANGTTVLSWNSSVQVGVGTSVPQVTSAFEVGSQSAVRIRNNGWLEYHQAQVPIVSSCGTGASAASGTDMAGDVTIGSTPAATCTITFAESPSNIPHCFASNRTSKLVTIAQPTATTLVIVGSGAGNFSNANDVIDYVCLGHQ